MKEKGNFAFFFILLSLNGYLGVSRLELENGA